MRPLLSRLAIAAALAPALLVALGATPAQAAFEGVGCFAGTLPGLADSCKPIAEEKFGEEVQLGGLGGMAVNYIGAGGVPKGTVYAAGFQAVGTGRRITMFVPKPGGGLAFDHSWIVAAEPNPAYERCGPGLPTPTVCQPRIDNQAGWVDVDIDQTTGNVYVLNGANPQAGRKMIIEYTPDGEEEITRFAETAPSGKTTAETPEQIHNSFQGGLAVTDAGEVYVYDLNVEGNPYHRLMKFVPKTPGKFDEYEYAGTAEDIAAGIVGQGGRDAREPVLDAAGNIYTVAGSSGTHIEAYDPDSPGAPPVCSFNFAPTTITAITVNPATGEPFFFAYKAPKRLYRLGPCNEASGKFEGPKGEEIVEELVVAPERDDVWGLAFDPVRQFSPGRPAGVLYAGAPGPTPTSGVGVGEEGQSSLGYIFAPAEENPPLVKSQSVLKVTATSAQLRAVVDPEGFKTRYLFEYLTEQAYEEGGESFAGAMQAPPAEAFLKETGAEESVGATLTGLEPDTEYRYRAVAISHCAAGEPEKSCEDQAPVARLHTYPEADPALLPDGRAYELVSPAQKNGGQVFPADPRFSAGCGLNPDCKPGNQYVHWPMQSSPDGDAVAYEGTAFEPGVGAAIENSYIARRDAKLGWQSVNPTPPLLISGGGSRGYMAYDPDFHRAVVAQARPALSAAAPPEYENLYAQSTLNPFALSPLLSAPPPNRPATESGFFKIAYAGASSDFSRVFFEANDALTEEVPGIAPTPEDGGPTKFNLYEWEAATGQLRLVNVLPGNATTKVGAAFGVASANAVSADGSRAFWSDETGQVYVREDAALTTEIPDPGKFLSASTDGSKVLLTNGHLYDLETKATTDLTGGKGGFQGIAGQSDDLSHVYFVDTEILTGEGENSEGAKAQAGKSNLYAWSEEGPATHFVATLLTADSSGSNLVRGQAWAALPSQRTAEASQNGRYLAFQSQAQLTGFEGPCENSAGGKEEEGACAKVFLYDSQTGKLICPACNRTGERSQGWSIPRRILGSASLPQPRYLTDEGRLYFDSQESLSPLDTNEGIEDVYQYEPDGIGACKREAGCVSLISAGTGTVDSNFLAIDETGANVFFTTREPLVLRDKDELVDLYDAREGAPPPSETETQRPECQGEACQPAPAPAEDPPLGSASVEGSGNVTEGKPSSSRCPKGKRRVASRGRVRCVARRHHKSSRAHDRRGMAGKRGRG